MRVKNIAPAMSFVLFVMYFGPIVFKLKDIPLAVVVIGGIILVGVDVWGALTEKSA
jgi:hypothetical protein